MQQTRNVFKPVFAISYWMASISVEAQDPVANFTADNTSGCGPLRILFTDQSTSSRFLELGFWKRTVVLKQNPTVTYSQPGTYTVRLIMLLQALTINQNRLSGICLPNFF
jgi:PKD repeat protein